MQADFDVDCTPGAYVPSLHISHTDEPVTSEYFPTGHAAHVLALVMFPNLPGSQDAQDSAVLSKYSPTVQLSAQADVLFAKQDNRFHCWNVHVGTELLYVTVPATHVVT